jgi:prepilin-type N-terminal cleavage/methylation domain-containing protein
MEIKRKAFTLVEILVAIIIVGIFMFATIKAYSQLTKAYEINEIRYQALRAIDSEMNRLLYHYENYDIGNFAKYDDSSQATWDNYLAIDYNCNESNKKKCYNCFKSNKLSKNYGLEIINIDNVTKVDSDNLIELVDKNNNPNIIDEGDIVGVMGWNVKYFNSPDIAHISLSITYPYIAGEETKILWFDNRKLLEISNIPLETINLKTSTKRK